MTRAGIMAGVWGLGDRGLPRAVATPLFDTSRSVGSDPGSGSPVVFTSAVCPGATEEMGVSLLERERRLEWKRDFFVGYSTQRDSKSALVRGLFRLFKYLEIAEARAGRSSGFVGWRV